MDFIDQLRLLASRIAATRSMVQTEEATKTAMIMPFIQILGYNVFDPTEVTPELVADIGTKKGEKVDYAILRDGKPIMLFECKKAGAELSVNNAGQLFRYFHVTAARFGVLTNGLTYRFFTDLEQPNKMDDTPFLEFNILDFKDRDVEELKKFARAAFDIDLILTTANELKYTRAIQQKLSSWIASPSEELVRLVATDLVAGRRFTPATRDQFTMITRRAFEQLIAERINERLKGAMAPELPIAEPVAAPGVNAPAEALPPLPSDSVVTTSPEEQEGFLTIRAILRSIIPSKRVTMRDAQTYCAILLDDNNRRPICRLRFNNPDRLRVGLFGPNREETIIAIDSVDDLFLHAEAIIQTVNSYVAT